MSVSDSAVPTGDPRALPSEPLLARKADLVEVYVWELPVRLAHWLIVGSLLLLTVTGIYMGTPFLSVPGEAGESFVMGTAKAIHFWSAFVLIGAFLMRLVWMFSGNKFARWDKFVPILERRWKGILPTLKFYLFARRKPPGFIGHNPVAGLAYTAVYGLIAFEILSGLALYGASAHYDSPTRIFAGLLPLMGGAQTARFLHHLVMWFLWGFAFHHIWSSILMSTEEANATVESIFSGYKFVPPEDIVFSGYRFKPREELTPAQAAEVDRRRREEEG